MSHLVDRARVEPPTGCAVVPVSTPVVCFGNLYTARVATLGLNPSRLEFLDRTGHARADSDRRLETRASLGVRGQGPLTTDQAKRVVEGCLTYFHHNPYWDWFVQLETLLNRAIGASYLNGSACHLDVVQWATDPTWSRLPGSTRSKLVASDRPFLQAQLEECALGLVLVNGGGALAQIGRLGARLEPVEMASDGRATVRIEAGELLGVMVVGWSSNLQSGYGVSNALRAEISEQVGAQVDRNRSAPARQIATEGDAGYLIIRGTRVSSKSDLAILLDRWFRKTHETREPTIGDVGTFGGKAWIHLDFPSLQAVLNGDTTRDAVGAYLEDVRRRSAEVPWRVVTNRRGRVNKVVYNDDSRVTPGWYCYLIK